MKDRRDKDIGSENYHFIKETIKEKTDGKKYILKKAAVCAGGGVIFGFCAVFTFVILFPWVVGKVEQSHQQKVDVELSGAPGLTETEEAAGFAEDTVVEMEEQEAIVPSSSVEIDEEETVRILEEYEEIYESVLKIAEEPRKALVRVSGVSKDENLLDHSFLHYGEEEGIIFLESETDLYILTGSKEIENAEQIQITFVNDSFVMGEMCGMDSRIGLAVVRVPKIRLKEDVMEAISIVSLGDSEDQFLAKPVIAIGSLMEEYDGVMYGMVTSVSGKVSVADGEYGQIITDIQGSPESDGVLLDISGNVIGIIMQDEVQDIHIIKAVSVSQLRSLIEILCNNDPINYLGILGSSISKAKADSLGVPQGIYVDNVETDSPAMIAGIQSGDIITEFEGEEIKDMQVYTTKLQAMEPGEKVKISLVRRSAADGSYVEMDFDLIIEER